MALIYVTRKILDSGIAHLARAGHTVDVSTKDGVLSKDELVAALSSKPYDAVLCLLTDRIDKDVFAAASSAKIFANYAVGYDNIDIEEAKQRGIIVTNTPDVLTDAVAEHTLALMLALLRRIPESERFLREGKYEGWAPLLFLGTGLRGKTLGLLGAGRIGARVAHEAARGFDMRVVYHDVARNEVLEKEYKAAFCSSPEEVLQAADVVSLHVPLLPSTRHLIDARRLALMKPTAVLINTSRGPVVDEAALVTALRTGVIRGAALDVFENEPALAEGLAELPNVVLTPHTASATVEAREAMAEVAAEDIIAVLGGGAPAHRVA